MHAFVSVCMFGVRWVCIEGMSVPLCMIDTGQNGVRMYIVSVATYFFSLCGLLMPFMLILITAPK